MHKEQPSSAAQLTKPPLKNEARPALRKLLQLVIQQAKEKARHQANLIFNLSPNRNRPIRKKSKTSAAFSAAARARTKSPRFAVVWTLKETSQKDYVAVATTPSAKSVKNIAATSKSKHQAQRNQQECRTMKASRRTLASNFAECWVRMRAWEIAQ